MNNGSAILFFVYTLRSLSTPMMEASQKGNASRKVFHNVVVDRRTHRITLHGTEVDSETGWMNHYEHLEKMVFILVFFYVYFHE